MSKTCLGLSTFWRRNYHGRDKAAVKTCSCLFGGSDRFITLIMLLGGHGTLARAEPVADAPQTAQVTANQEAAVESTTPATGTVNETSPPAQNSTAAQENLTETTTPQTTTSQTITSQTTKSQATSETAPVQQTNQQPTVVGEQPRDVNEPVAQTAPVTTTDSKQSDQGARRQQLRRLSINQT